MALQATFAEERRRLIKTILSTDLHGKRIYLLGSAEFGPTNEPILCRSSVGVKTKFGSNGTLIDAFHKIKYVSKDNYIYLVKTTGNESSAYLNIISGNECVHNGFMLMTTESNEIYNEMKVIIDIDSIKIVYPNSMPYGTMTYSFNDYKTIEQLAEKINQDTKNNKGKVQAFYSVPSETKTTDGNLFVCNNSEVYFYGGYCGLNYTKNMLYNCLERTYELLESADVDIIIPVDAFLDDVYPDDPYSDELHYGEKYYQTSKDYLTRFIDGKQLSYMNQLINFCVKQLNFGVVTHGIIGFNSMYAQYSNYYNESNEMSLMLKSCFNYNLSCCDNPSYSFLISVVGGDVYYNQGTYIDNGYLAYAALCADTILNIGTTNIPISNSLSIYHELEEPYIGELAELGIVMFRHSPLYNTPVIYSGTTAGQYDNDLKVFCNVRMIQLTISYINKLFQLYIGNPINYLLEENIIVDDLTELLSNLKQREIISNYEFDIVPNYNNNELKVYLKLETRYMVKAVTVCPVINVEFQENEV